ncbi:hypothetical protein KQX62_04100 [Rhodopseudomonas palustris]|uniref:Polysaccharide chain length determinant N-terminal domain-containing protein n=1 Tax=Rhodopseudomonas palustris TaxID=1076 RepID=A0AAX3E0U3_RHOPL|nr:hypothetical protein [Rhodopseudomonas palustris]UYO40501.1 hypothetical protein KQX62_04100 [Rhodopseudomonas palustris]
MEDHALEGGTSPLDIAVVVAENWLLLILVPLLAGVIVFGVISATTPNVYETEAILAIDEREAALVQTSPVLDKAMAGSPSFAGLPGTSSGARGESLARHLTVAKEATSDWYRLRLRGDNATHLKEVLYSIIQALISSSVPSPVEIARINQEIEQTAASLEGLERALRNVDRILASKDATVDHAGGEFAASVVSLISGIERRRSKLFDLELAKQGSVRSEDVIQPPTQSRMSNSRSSLLPALAVMLGVGLFLLILVFIRDGLRRASNDPEQVTKVNRIRRAFWLRLLASK